MKSIHSYVEWVEIKKTVEEDRVLRITTGSSKYEDPFIHYPLDEATNDYVQKELAILSPFGKLTQLQFTDSIIGMNADKISQDIECPLFVAHGKDNLLHPVDESVQFFEAAAEPKELYIIDGNIMILCIMSIRCSSSWLGNLRGFLGRIILNWRL